MFKHSWVVVVWLLLAMVLAGLPIYGAQAVEADNYRFQPEFSIWGKTNPYRKNNLRNINTAAPKGGTITLPEVGTFDSFNPFLIQGIAPASINMIYDRLMAGGGGDDDVVYGLIADGIYVSPDKKTIAFHIDPRAKFYDGVPITADDVVWTFQTLITVADPSFQAYYRDVDTVRAVKKDIVVFTTKNANNREIPQILSGLVVLPKHFWQGKDFTKPSLTPPLGTGPYRIKNFLPGQYIIYELVPDYWARNLKNRKGLNNFATIKYQFYRDNTIEFEAFKAGKTDLRVEPVARVWATGYNIPAVKNGQIIKRTIPHTRIAPTQMIMFNLRRPLFEGKDGRALRHALQLLWNFEWINDNLMYGAYTRTASVFDNSPLRARGLPSKAELELLLPFKDELPPEVFGPAYTPPNNAGDNYRANMLKAVKILEEAGFYYEGQNLYSPKKIPVEFTISLDSPLFVGVLLPFSQAVKRIGGKVNLRVMDGTVLTRQLLNFNYDSMVSGFANSESPGTEQRVLWGAKAANQMGGRNLIGVQSPALDALIDKLVAARDYKDVVTMAHAMDRILMWQYYFIPMYYSNYDRVAYWNKISCPESSGEGFDLMACWSKKP